MKILFPYMARWYSLNWSRYHSLLIALAQRGHEIHVLQPPALQSQETNFVEITPVPVPGLHVHDVQVPNWLWRRRLPFDKLFKKALVSICSVRQARRLAREHGITHVMLYNIPQAPLARLPGVSTVFDYADDYMDMLRHELGRMSNPLIMGFARGLLNYMFRNASLVTTVSHVLAEGNAHTMTVLPNGVSTAKVGTVPATEALSRPGARPVVGFLGSFEYFIDFDLILDAAQGLPEVDFLLVGKGRDYEGVAREVQRRGLKNVELAGGAPRRGVPTHRPHGHLPQHLPQDPGFRASLSDQALRVRGHAQTHRLHSTGRTQACGQGLPVLRRQRERGHRARPRDSCGPPERAATR